MFKELLAEIKIDEQRINRFVSIFFIVIILGWLLSGIYQINANEAGLLRIFGALQPGNIQPGIHYRLPWPVSKIDKVKITEVKSMDVGFYFGDEAFMLESLIPYCITGDVNIIHNRFTIQYRISDPAKYKFSHNNPEGLLYTFAKSTIIQVMSRRGVDPVLTTEKSEVAEEIRAQLQTRSEDLDLGISIISIDTKMITPPENVKGAFEDVINAQAQKATMVHDAENYRNREIPAANAEANRLKEGAEAYKTGRIDMAEGEASRFMNLYAKYKTEPDITRNRLFYQMIDEILPEINVIVLATDADGDPVKIKLLNGPMPTKPIIPELDD